ncbi:large ribosomal subunit protein uL4m-like [Amphiura filiformis]|uniref:large ribosomal subunit protein uL4m-like n=1 Tax=Amphiura filiformis TaxID=82378 RepID=UPI003B2202AF
MLSRFTGLCRGCVRVTLRPSFQAVRLSSTDDGGSKVVMMPEEFQQQPTYTDPNEKWPNLPLITDRDVLSPPHLPKPQAWLETLSFKENIKLGLIDLHPDIYATVPRLDIIHENVVWQRNYKRISNAKTKTRAEMRGGGRKPWPQKGLGKARHGSIRSPIWKGGGRAHGPRGPKSYWYVIPEKVRALGLSSLLSVKMAQDDLHIVDSLEIPNTDPKFLEDVGKERHWAESVLFVDRLPLEEISENFMEACSRVKTYNVLTTEGFNVFTALKHKTLVLTLDAADFLEHRILYLLNRYDQKKRKNFDVNQRIIYGQMGLDPLGRDRYT